MGRRYFRPRLDSLHDGRFARVPAVPDPIERVYKEELARIIDVQWLNWGQSFLRQSRQREFKVSKNKKFKMQSAQPTAAAQPPTAKPPSQQKRRRPTPHPLPQALAGLFPVERDLWQRLQRQEQRLDALLVRKRLDIQETLTRFPKVQNLNLISLWDA